MLATDRAIRGVLTAREFEIIVGKIERDDEEGRGIALKDVYALADAFRALVDVIKSYREAMTAIDDLRAQQPKPLTVDNASA